MVLVAMVMPTGMYCIPYHLTLTLHPIISRASSYETQTNNYCNKCSEAASESLDKHKFIRHLEEAQPSNIMALQSIYNPLYRYGKCGS